MSLTVEKIHAAADDLANQGINPTQTKVRDALGGGSFSTIGEALKTWKQEQKEHEQLKQTDMPDDLKEEGIVHLAKIWQIADKIANDRLATAREALVVAQANSEAEVKEAQEAVETLEKEQDDIKAQLASMTDISDKATADAERYVAERDALNSKLIDTQHKLDIQTERTNAATTQNAELNTKIEAIRVQLDETKEKLSSEQGVSLSFKAANGMQEREIKKLEAEIKNGHDENEKIAAQLTERTAERDDLNKKLATAIAKLEAATAQIEQFTVEREKLYTENKELAVNASQLKNNADQLTAENKKLSESITKLETDNKSLNDKLIEKNLKADKALKS